MFKIKNHALSKEQCTDVGRVGLSRSMCSTECFSINIYFILSIVPIRPTSPDLSKRSDIRGFFPSTVIAALSCILKSTRFSLWLHCAAVLMFPLCCSFYFFLVVLGLHLIFRLWILVFPLLDLLFCYILRENLLLLCLTGGLFRAHEKNTKAIFKKVITNHHFPLPLCPCPSDAATQPSGVKNRPTWRHQTVTVNDKLCCGGGFQKFQRETQARCAVWFSMTKTAVCLVTDCHPKQSKTGWVMPKENPPPDRLVSSQTVLPGLHSLSMWITQQLVCCSPFVFHFTSFGSHLLSSTVSSLPVWHWVELNDAGTQLADSSKHRQRRKRRGVRERLLVICILDLNKALQDVREPVFGQEKNAKQALQETIKTVG